MEHVSKLSPESKIILTQLMRKSADTLTRKRACAILLSSEKYSKEKIARMLGEEASTVGEWLARWESKEKGSRLVRSVGRPKDKPVAPRPNVGANRFVVGVSGKRKDSPFLHAFIDIMAIL